MDVSVQSLVEQIIDKIMDLVKERRLTPGDRLPTEKELTELFGVGRSTVREAICQLQNLGVLAVRQGKGTFLQEVSPRTLLNSQDPLYKFVDLSRDELQDAMDVRKLLETEIVRLVTRKIDGKGLAKLKESLESHRKAGDSLTSYQRDLQFHMVLANLSGNSILPFMFNLVHKFLDRYTAIVAETLESPAYSEKILEQHRQIYLAIASGDEERAAQVLLRHLNTSQMTVLASFDIYSEKIRLSLA